MSRKYTGWNGNAKGRRAGLEKLVDLCEEFFPVFNNGTWGVRNKRGKRTASVHGTGRAADLSWRGAPHRGSGNYDDAHRLMEFLTRSDVAEALEIEAVFDYWNHYGRYGRGWRCDRNKWTIYKRKAFAGVPGDWLHVEISDRYADDPDYINHWFRHLIGSPAAPAAPAQADDRRWKTFIDISKWQGAVNFGVLKASGVDALYMRAYQGMTRDERVDEYAAGAKAHGIPFGLYTYWRPKYSVDEQLDVLCAAHNNLGASLVPMLDIEHGDEKDPSFIGQQVNEAVAGIERRLGVTPTIYTASWFWNPAVHGADVARCPLWLARYSASNPVPENPADWAAHALQFAEPAIPDGGWTRWSAWQFSADGNHMGHTYGASSSHLDLNILREEDWSRFQAVRATPPPPVINEQMEFEMKLVAPARVYDSRNSGMFQPNETREIQVGAVNAAFVNLTVVNAGGAGYLSAWGAGQPQPNVSNVNFAPGQTIANSAWVPVVDGKINVFTSASAHVLVDIQASN